MKKRQIVIEIDDGDFWDIQRFGPRFGLTRDDRVIRAVQNGVPLDQHKAVKKLQKKVEQLKQRLNSVQESKTDALDKISAEIKVQGRKRGLNMADIELVIKIPEKDYHRIAMGFGQEEDAVLLKKIFRNGTPLPEQHGRLLILNEERVNANSIKLGDWSCQKWISEVGISNSTVAIISATKEGDVK